MRAGTRRHLRLRQLRERATLPGSAPCPENRYQFSRTYKQRDKAPAADGVGAAGIMRPARRPLYSVDLSGNRSEIDTSAMSDRAYEKLTAVFESQRTHWDVHRNQ